VAQTQTEPARSGFSSNRYNTHGPKIEPLLTLHTIDVASHSACIGFIHEQSACKMTHQVLGGP